MQSLQNKTKEPHGGSHGGWGSFVLWFACFGFTVRWVCRYETTRNHGTVNVLWKRMMGIGHLGGSAHSGLGERSTP